MRYEGMKAPVPIGRGGLFTDASPSDIPATHLREASNVLVRNGRLEKDYGSRRWNKTAQASGIVALREWAPTEARSYVYAITRDGEIFRYRNWEARDQLAAASAASPASLSIAKNSVYIVEGGNEAQGEPRKLFIFTRNNQIQVITADGLTYRNITTPSADFASGVFPRFGVVHRDRLWVFMNHQAYASDPTDHEDFTSASAIQFAVYPGEGEFFQSAYVFKDQLFVFKRGKGLYRLIDDDPDSGNWFFARLSGEFAVAAHEATVEVLGDLLSLNDAGSVTSLRAVQEFGDIAAADLLGALRVKDYLLSKASTSDLENRRALYDPVTKTAYLLYRPVEKTLPNAMWKLDYSNPQRPEITLDDKDQANCLALLEMPTGKKKPFYGSEDGFIYEMNCADREVGIVSKPSSPMTAADGGAGLMAAGTYSFVVVFGDSSESALTLPGGPSNALAIGANRQISLTGIPVSSHSSVDERRIYGKLSTQTEYYEVAVISDNVTTSTTINADIDTTADKAPLVNSFNRSYLSRIVTPHISFAHVEPQIGPMQKHFDFIELGYVPKVRVLEDTYSAFDDTILGYWIDGIFKRTREFELSKGPVLGDFDLDINRLDSGALRWVRFKLHGSGRSLGIYLEQPGKMTNFVITEMNVYFRLGNEDQKAINSGRKAS